MASRVAMGPLRSQQLLDAGLASSAAEWKEVEEDLGTLLCLTPQQQTPRLSHQDS